MNEPKPGVLKKLEREGKIEIAESSQHDLETAHANKLLRDSGRHLCRMTERYLGSACVHFYEVIGKENEVTVKCQSPLGREINEIQAFFGHLKLQEKLRAFYGREKKK
jgi:hypothetical protein